MANEIKCKEKAEVGFTTMPVCWSCKHRIGGLGPQGVIGGVCEIMGLDVPLDGICRKYEKHGDAKVGRETPNEPKAGGCSNPILAFIIPIALWLALLVSAMFIF